MKHTNAAAMHVKDRRGSREDGEVHEFLLCARRSWAEITYSEMFDPRLVRNIGIFDVKGSVEEIKATDCQEFLSIDGARSTPGPKDRDGLEVLLARLDLIVPEVKSTSFESCTCFSRFFSPASCIGKE